MVLANAITIGAGKHAGYSLTCCWLLVLCLPWNSLHAQAIDWSLSPMLGVHHPTLKNINEGLFRSPLAGVADFLDESGATFPQDFVLSTPLEELDPSSWAGLEFEWHMTSRLSWLIGFGTWEGSSIAVSGADFPIQRTNSRVAVERSSKISYNEVFLGARYAFWAKPRKFRIYGRMSINNILDIDLRDQHILQFETANADSFSRTIILDANATGVVLFQGGLGADFLIGERFSLGVEGALTMNLRQFFFRNPQINSDLTETDGFGSVLLPAAPDNEGRLRFLEEDGSTYSDMPLNFNGWKLLFRISIFY